MQGVWVEGTFHKLTERRAFSCAHCGHHVYPTAGTVFQDTRTPLQVWFYAIYLFVTTRHGVSGKELQRDAWCDLQDRVAHGPANPRAHGEG